MEDISDMPAVISACADVKRCFQLKDVPLVATCVQKVLRYFEEEAIDQFVADIRAQASDFDAYIEKLPPYEKNNLRQSIEAEQTYFKILQGIKSINRRDIDRAAAVFALLYTENEPDLAAQISLEFLSAISILRVQNDGETVFSLKSRDHPVKPATVCGANVIGALSPISEKSGVHYEPINQQPGHPQASAVAQQLAASLPATSVPQVSQPQVLLKSAGNAVPYVPPVLTPGAHQVVAPILSYQNITPTWQSSFNQAPFSMPQQPMINPWQQQMATQQPYHLHSVPSNTVAVNEADHQAKISQLESYVKLKSNLIRGAPVFDGKSDFDVFITNLHEYLADLPYVTEHLKKAVLKASCKGTAQDYLATIPALASQPFDNVLSYLHQRFGRDVLSKKLYFDSLVQNQQETLYEFADRLQTAAIGTFRTNEEVINRFICGLKDKQLAEKLSILEFSSIPQVLAKAEKHLNVRSNINQERKNFDSRDKNKNFRDSSEYKASDQKQSWKNDRQKSDNQKQDFKNKSQPKFQKKANAVYQSDSDSDEREPVNNMVEIFSLSNDEFQDSLNQIMAAKTERAPAPRYNLRSNAGVSKPAADTSQTEASQRESIREALFPRREAATDKVAEDQEMVDAPQPEPSQPSSSQIVPNQASQPILSQLPLPPAPPSAPQQVVQPAPQPITRTSRTKSGHRDVPAPAFLPLYGEKPPIGDYLALLCGNNEFLQKVLISELRNRYFELTTVPKSTAKTPVAAAISVTPPKRAPLQFNKVTLNNGTPIGACADTGAEISLISTAALKKAGVDFSWKQLSDGYPVKGIGPDPQTSKTIVLKLTFLHDTTPLKVPVALSVIDSADYRFLIGRDVLRPLKYSIDEDGLTLTNPKTDERATYTFSTSSAFHVSHDFASINTAEPFIKKMVLKGDIDAPKTKFSAKTAFKSSKIYSKITKGDGSLPPRKDKKLGAPARTSVSSRTSSRSLENRRAPPRSSSCRRAFARTTTYCRDVSRAPSRLRASPRTAFPLREQPRTYFSPRATAQPVSSAREHPRTQEYRRASLRTFNKAQALSPTSSCPSNVSASSRQTNMRRTNVPTLSPHREPSRTSTACRATSGTTLQGRTTVHTSADRRSVSHTSKHQRIRPRSFPTNHMTSRQVSESQVKDTKGETSQSPQTFAQRMCRLRGTKYKQ